MTDKVKQLAPKIWGEIQKANKILLSFHRGPDGDSFGSNLALFHGLKSLGKDITLIQGDSVPTESIKAFPGFENITPKNIFEVDLSKFDLFVFLDGSSLTQISKLGQVTFPNNLTTIVIDHHPNSAVPAKIMLNDLTYPALGQMIFDLFKLWKIPMTPEIAACLFLAIYTDSLFKYPGTTAETFEIAAQLVQIYPNFPKAVGTFENDLTPTQLTYWSLALSQTKYLFSGKVAISTVSFDDLTKTKILPDIISTATISEILRSVLGVKISVALAEKEKQISSVSFRSFDMDVSQLALALNGGGHEGASGALLKMAADEAEKKILEVIQKIYPELGKP